MIRGFTLVELLTVLAVLGVLLGLLVPALNQVSKTATKVKQKAQFHAIGTALETFRNDYGDYPPSDYTDDGVMGSDYAVPSHHLAEALIGRDGLGFHSSSQFRADGMADIAGDGTPDDVIYGDPAGYTAETPAENLAARKGPYLELESANAVNVDNISAGLTSMGVSTGSLISNVFILADMYKILKNTATGKEVGMPILYYKADSMKIGNDPLDWSNSTYDYGGNFCGGSGFMGSTTSDVEFYKAIENPNFTNPKRPYRAESFLLQSAGPDGEYGTADDMFNFDTEK